MQTFQKTLDVVSLKLTVEYPSKRIKQNSPNPTAIRMRTKQLFAQLHLAIRQICCVSIIIDDYEYRQFLQIDICLV